MKHRIMTEPNMEMACQWWPDIPNIWTPVGWKDHMFRFNVFWNGMVLAKPNLNRRTTAWEGQGLQLHFLPSYNRKGTMGFFRPPSQHRDDGMIRQGWSDSQAPVLWSEWAFDGVILRQYIFAHIPGGRDVKTGIEPLFAWIRLAIHDCCPALPLEDQIGFHLWFFAPHISCGMNFRDNVGFYLSKRALYPRRLAPDSEGYSQQNGYRILEEDGKVRLAIAPKQQCAASFRSANDKNIPAWDYNALLDAVSRLYIEMEAKKGRYVDILLPMLPTERAVFDEELAQGYEACLKQADHYWSKVPATAARVNVPESFINDAIKHNLKFYEVIAEKNPLTEKYCLISGSLQYADLWATPGAMTCVMFMDTMGYHSVVEKYLEIFKEEQGTVCPPGASFKLHPGYLSTPAAYKSCDWLTDHGAILYAFAIHGLLSGNQEFVRRFTDAIVKACEFIKDARALTGHKGVPGVLPPAVATDRGTEIQSVWSIGWNYKGLLAAVKLLRQIGHPRAGEFAAEAENYRTVFVKALRQAVRKKAQWTDSHGQNHSFVPTSLAGDIKEETRHAFYLDAGPLFLVFAGLLDADDPLMKSTLLWFREGPQTKMRRHDSNCWQVPFLDHEMSSCEPCYSWNIFHSWQTGDRQRFLEGMYSLWAGSLSRKTFTLCETRGGITGLTPCLPYLYLTRLAVIDDEIREGELHLLRLAPLAWLQAGKETVFEKMPTVFGPVTLKFKLMKVKRTLQIVFKPDFRLGPEKVILHVPPVGGLRRIKVNNKIVRWDGRQKSVELENWK